MKTLGIDRARWDALRHRFGVAHFDIFGLVARGETGPERDIDLLYELEQDCSFGWEIDLSCTVFSALLGC